MSAQVMESLVIRLMGDSSGAEKMFKDIGAAAETASAKMREVGASLTKYVTAPITALGAVSVNAFATFDKAMTEATSIMGNVAPEQITRMRDAALTLSTQAVQGPAELAKGFYYLAGAGYNAEQAIGALPIVARFATAGAFDLEQATSMLTSAQAALGMATGTNEQRMANMARISDVLASANNVAQGSIKDFAEALSSDAASAMKTFGIDLEQGVAVLAVMAEQGNRGMAAGSEFARMMRLIGTEARDNAGAFKKFGIEVFDKSGKFNNIADIFRDMERALGGLSAEAKGAALEELGFKALTQRAIMPLIGTSEQMRGFLGTFGAAGGTSADVAAKQMEAFSNQLKILLNRVTVVAIAIGEHLAPMVLFLGRVVAVVAGVFTAMPAPVQAVILTLLGLAAALGPILLVAGAIGPMWAVIWGNAVVVINLAKAAVVAFGSALMTMGASIATSPMTAWLIAIGAGIAIVYGMRAACMALSGEGQVLAAQLEASRSASQAFATQYSQDTKRILAQAGQLPSAMRKAFLEGQIAIASQQVNQLSNSLNMAQGRVRHFGGLWNTLVGDRRLQLANADVEQLGGRLTSAQGRLAELRDKLNQFQTTTGTAQLGANVEELTKKLREQFHTAGLSTQAIERRALVMAGAGREEMAAVDREIALAKAGEAAAALQKSGGDLVTNMQDQIAVFGLSSSEAQVYRYELERVRTIQQAQIATAHLGTEAQALYMAQLRSATNEHSAQIRALAEHQAQLEAWADVQKRAADITEQFRSPQEKFAERLQELNVLWDDGEISTDTYNRALAEAQKQLDGTADSANKTKNAISGVQAALVGSAESNARIMDYYRMLGGDGASAMSTASRAVAATPRVPSIMTGDWIGASRELVGPPAPREFVGPPTPTQSQGAPAASEQRASAESYLQQIAQNTAELLKKPTLQVETADFT